MTTRNYVLYGGAAAIVTVGALAFGVPLYYLAIFLVCPLMMFFMMRGMHSGGGGTDQHARGTDQHTDRSKPHDHTSPR